MTSKEDCIYLAKLAEQAERYDDMTHYMKLFVKENAKCARLTAEERNLLSVAYKNLVGSRRASWRIISAVETKDAKCSTENATLAREYREKIEAELHEVCNEVLGLLDSKLIPGADNAESSVFYNKMRADYYRYISEFTVDEEKEKAAECAEQAYQIASDIANQELCSTHPVRLGLNLNFSVFYYEIKNESSKACAMAKEAFDNAICEFDQVAEDCYKDSTLIMQLLRDNLTLWTSDVQADGEPTGEKASVEGEGDE